MSQRVVSVVFFLAITGLSRPLLVTAEASSIARATKIDGGMQPESLLTMDGDNETTTSPTTFPQAPPSGFPVSDADIVAMVVIPLGAFILICVALRCSYCKCNRPPATLVSIEHTSVPHNDVGDDDEDLFMDGADDIGLLPLYTLTSDGHKVESVKSEKDFKPSPMGFKGKVLSAGVATGDYGMHWTNTFDAVFLAFMVVAFVALIITTQLWRPDIWSKPMFWVALIAKFVTMTVVSLLGGLLCRRFASMDSKGYIVTTASSWFKVNYTRKLQHFAAYMVPLVISPPADCNCGGMISDLWGTWITLLAFMILIKPIRERLTVVMLQFNSLDRPEDRPNTLKWIVLGNILPGLCLIILYKNIYMFTGHSEDLVYIFIYITGIGDGLAEPVGIWLGRHKYTTRSCFNPRKYTRSYEGSACVFLSGLIFPLVQYADFDSSTQMWLAAALLAPCMTVAEATSPHTMDTPFLMSFGGLLIFLVVHFVQ